MRSFVAFTLGGAYLFTDELENAVRAFEEASTMGKSGGNIHIVLPAQRARAYVQAEQGDLSQSAATSREAVRFVTDKRGRRSPVAAGALGTLGNVYYEWNELEEAGRYLAEAIELGSRWGNPDSALSNYVRMARVQYALGDIEAGDQFLQSAERMLQKQQLTPATHSILTNQQVKNWIARAKLAQVLDWVENHAPDIETQILYTNQRAYQSLARAMLALGELDSAGELLNRLYDWAKGKALKGRLIQVLVLQARLEQARGNTPQACAILEQALALGESQGYRRTFLDEGRPLGELLNVIASHGLAQDYARQLLSMLIAETGESESSEQGVRLVGDVLIETPSQREIEVLRLIAEGLTNQQIAERLVISLGTVKAHSSNIYRKLGVRNRTQALARARELNLI